MEAATLEAPAPVHMEAPASVLPQPTVAEILDQHLDHSQQKKIAVDNLSSIKFLIAPHGDKAISTKEIKSPEHREIIEASLKAVLGHRADNAPYLPAADGIGEKLGLSSGSNFVQVEGRGTIKMLAEAGVKDFAEALDVKQHNHAAKLR
jgi:hypothetical protein